MAQAWKIAFMELKNRWLGLCGMILFALLVGMILGSELVNFAMYGKEHLDTFLSSVVDYLLIALLPCFGGLTFGREYYSISSTISEEPFLRRLRFYRMYPIPLDLIVTSRIFFMLLCFLATVPLLFICMTVYAWPQIGEVMSGMELFSFALIWFSYALAMAGVVPYLEFGHNGKVVIFSTFMATILILFIVIAFRWLFDQSLFALTIQAVQQFTWIPGMFMLFIAVVVNIIWKKKLQSRIAQRDFP